MDDGLILVGDFTAHSGRDHMKELLDGPAPLPTAVFCANDAVAYGALELLQARGVQAPMSSHQYKNSSSPMPSVER